MSDETKATRKLSAILSADVKGDSVLMADDDLRQGLADWINGYNHIRGHSSLDDKTSDEVYYGLPHPFAQAA